MFKILFISLIISLCSGCLQLSKDPSNKSPDKQTDELSFEILKLLPSQSEIKANCVIRAQNKIWVGTNNGILSFDSETLELQKHYLKNRKIGKLAVSSGNFIFARVIKKGLYSLPPDEFDFFSTGSTRIRDFVIKRGTNDVYCATSHGVDIYQNSAFKTIKVRGQGEFPKNANNILKITQDKEGNFWLGTTFGLYKMINESSFKLYLANYQIVQASSVINKSGNSPLIGNYFEDLKYLENLNHLLISTNTGLSILTDPQNPRNTNSWISYTGNHGKSTVVDGEVVEKKVRGNSPLPSNYILNALQTKKSLYIGTEDGLTIFRNNKWSTLNIDSDFIDDKIMDLYLFKKLDKNIIYIATQSGIAIINEKKFAN
ncbi:MAG: hypothetical protein COB02_08360 [Candidatus Cloacimonadota bacterium]|nr:MAG: hypothetical protein COB02_08360 [Candidatus Cloacimonadota bacterium]